jgi:hypothetical protein
MRQATFGMTSLGFAGAVLGTCVAACSPYLFSPPARMMPLEAAKALPKGDVALQAALGGGAEVWGPVVGAGTVQARYGFGRGFEGAAEAGFAAFGPLDTDWSTSASHALFAGRVGFKYEAVSWFAAQAGFGGGVSAAGGYISPDAGVIFSYQGKAVVPFVAGGFFYSLPLNAKEIVFTEADPTGPDPMEVLRPDQTIGGYGNLGLRIPITPPRARDDSPRTAMMFAYRLVFAVHDEEDGRQTDFYNLGVVGFDLVLRKNRSPGGSGRRWELY